MAIIKRKLGNNKQVIIQHFRESGRENGLGGLAFSMFCEGWQAAWKEHTVLNQERIKELESENKKLVLYKEYVETRISEGIIPMTYERWNYNIEELAKELEQALKGGDV